MLTKKQIRIISVFNEDVNKELTFKQLKEKSNQKSNNFVQKALKDFRKWDLIKTRKIGNIKIYSLNLENNLSMSYLNLINESEIKKNKLPKEILKEIQGKILRYTEFFILIVFGSYAKNKSNNNSDLDIAIIIEDEQIKKEIIPLLETIKRREILKIDYHVFPRKEFLEMLKADYENLGKQINKNKIIYYGFIEYCYLLKNE